MTLVRLELTSHPAAATAAGGLRIALAPRDALLLAWLALEGPTARSRLAALLWPASGDEAARNTLRQRLFHLKRHWGDIVIGGATLTLGEEVRHDIGDSATLLDGLDPSDVPEIAAWLDSQRRRRHRAALDALEAQADRLERAGDPAAALRVAADLLEREPLKEPAHRRLMRLHYLGGDRAAALLAFDRCERLLKDEIGARPSPETLSLLATIERASPEAPSPVQAPLPASVLRPPRLIGRQRELAALNQAWDEAQVAVVVGEAGLGKTRLLQAFIAQRGDAVVMASARPGDAGVPFATLARVLREVVQHAPAALNEAPRQEIARLLPEFGDAVARQGEGQRLVLERAVRSLLRAAHTQVGGVIVDDLQFADAASVEMLQVAISDDGHAGLRWTLAMRPADAGSVVQALADALIEQGRLAPIGLPSLDVSGLAALVRSLDLPQFDADTLAPALMQHTGGNPMFVLETLKRLWALPEGDRGATLPRPGNVGMLIDRRLTQLSASALTLARVAAIAGTDFAIALAEAVIGQPALQLATAWQELDAAQVLRDGAFAHDLVYEAALRSVPPHIARHTHAAVAQWLDAQGGEPARIAEHWLLAGHLPRAVPHLIEAGWLSSERTREPEARRFFERAVEASAACGARVLEFEALEALHENYTHADPGPAHDAVVQRLHELAETEEEHLRAASAAHNLRRRRSEPADLTALELDIARAERLGLRDLLRTLVTMQVGGLCTGGDPQGARDVLQRHRALFDSENDGDATQLLDFHGNLGAAFANLDLYAPALEHAQRNAAMARRLGQFDEVVTSMSNQLRVLRMQGRLERGLDLLAQLDRWHASDAPNLRSWLISRAGAAELLRDAGRFGEALQALQVEPESVRRHAGVVWPAWPVAAASLWLALGQHARAWQSLGAIDDMSLQHAPDWLQARVRLTQAQVGARAKGQGVADRPGAREWTWLNEASALAPRDRRRSAWIECELQRAAWVEPAVGAALAESLAAVAAQHDMRGCAQAALLCALRHRLDAGANVGALAIATRAAASHRFADEEAPEPVFPSTWNATRRDLVLALALRLDNPSAAQTALRAAADRLRRTAAGQVPEPYRAGFLQRHPDHVELLTKADTE